MRPPGTAGAGQPDQPGIYWKGSRSGHTEWRKNKEESLSADVQKGKEKHLATQIILQNKFQLTV